MKLKYFAGIEFNTQSGEFKSDPRDLPTEALSMVKLGNSKGYHKVTLYIKRGEDVVGIPYSELEELDDLKGDLEKALIDIANSRLP